MYGYICFENGFEGPDKVYDKFLVACQAMMKIMTTDYKLFSVNGILYKFLWKCFHWKFRFEPAFINVYKLKIILLILLLS